jgi:hypothetical protein
MDGVAGNRRADLQSVSCKPADDTPCVEIAKRKTDEWHLRENGWTVLWRVWMAVQNFEAVPFTRNAAG